MDREMTCFFCTELATLYLEGRLDKQRVTLVKAHIADCKNCKEYFKNLQSARNNLELLSSLQPPQEVVKLVQTERHPWQELVTEYGWRSWPATVRWATEISVFALSVVFVLRIVPWSDLGERVQKFRYNTAAHVTIPQNTEPFVADPSEKEPEPKPEIFGPPLPAGWVATSDASVEATPTPAVSQDKGYVWLGKLRVPRLTEDVADRVTQMVEEQGGRKAGQVELGWRKGSNRYYHFLMPEANYQQLIIKLNKEGLVSLVKTSHPRVIKDGHMRIIMTVEQDEEIR